MAFFRKAILVNGAVLASLAIQMVQTVVLTRILGPAGIGQYSLVTSTLMLSAQLCTLGFPVALLYSFFIDGQEVETGTRSLPPPKDLRRRKDGKLELVSFHRWTEKIQSSQPLAFDSFRPRLGNPVAGAEALRDAFCFRSRSGFEVFTTALDAGAWIWDGVWQTRQQGRCGLVFGLDDQLSGYFVFLDAERGGLRILAWGARPERVFQNYTYTKLQTGEFTPVDDRRHSFRLIRWKSYIELSVDGVVRLSLVDARFSGKNLGIFVESAEVALSGLRVHTLESRPEPGRGAGAPLEVAALPP